MTLEKKFYRVLSMPQCSGKHSHGIYDYLNIFCSLSDPDDDVRAVAASCLLPVAGHLVEQFPESLDRVLLVLWNCLRGMKDDLSSSVGAVMDLLGKSDCCLTE